MTHGTVDDTETEGAKAYVPLPVHIEDFLTDLANANRPANTIGAARFAGCEARHVPGLPGTLGFSAVPRR